jgi:hypothetical protein
MLMFNHPIFECEVISLNHAFLNIQGLRPLTDAEAQTVVGGTGPGEPFKLVLKQALKLGIKLLIKTVMKEIRKEQKEQREQCRPPAFRESPGFRS